MSLPAEQNSAHHGKFALIVIDRARDDAFAVRRVCAAVDRARREKTQIVFVREAAHGDGWGLVDALNPRFPDWVVARHDRDIFAGGNLAAQLRAVGIGKLVLAGDEACLEASQKTAQDLGFEVSEELPELA
jgi:nicotinamidase-related amidase